MIVFYRIASDSPNIRKVSLMLAETGLTHVVEIVAKQTGGELPATLSRISPNGTWPAIHDSETDAVVFESAAILYYLAQKTGRLLPAELRARSEVMKWLIFEAANIGPTMSELYHGMLADAGTGEVSTLDRYRQRLTRHCGILDQQLRGREYLCGDCSIADIALYPWMEIIEYMADLGLKDYPALGEWVDTMRRREVHPTE